jgi:hypothetical protein
MPLRMFAYIIVVPPLVVLYIGDRLLRSGLAETPAALISSNVNIDLLQSALLRNALTIGILFTALILLYVLATIVAVRTIRDLLGPNEQSFILSSALLLGVGAFLSQEYAFLLGETDTGRLYLALGEDLFAGAAEIAFGPERGLAMIEVFMFASHLFSLPAYGFVLFAFAAVLTTAMAANGYEIADNLIRLRRLLGWAAALVSAAICVMAAWRIWPAVMTGGSDLVEFQNRVSDTLWIQSVSFAVTLASLYIPIVIAMHWRAHRLAFIDAAPRDEDGWRTAHGLKLTFKAEIGPAVAIAVPLVIATVSHWIIQELSAIG